MRKELLKQLLLFQQPLAVINKKLSQLPWDSNEVVELQISHVINALQALLDGKVSKIDFELWANIIEGRDDIILEEAFANELKKFIYEAANPVLEGEINNKWIQDWIKLFSRN